ncbi:replication initiation protein RepB [Salinisphaera sp. T31B1]
MLLANAMSLHADSENFGGGVRQHWIDRNQFAKLVTGSRQSTNNLRRILNGLLKKTVEWNYIDENLRQRLGGSSWLAGYEMVDDIIKYSYSVEIVESILDPEVFARINYSVQHQLVRKQSLALYENCARYRDLGRTRAWSLDTFRALMGVSGRYPEFKILNRDVVKPSVKEINETTEIFVEPILKKHGHEVLAIQFIVLENTDYDGPPMPPLLAADVSDEIVADRLPTYEALLAFGLERNTAVNMLDEYDDQYIYDNLLVVSERIRAGKIRSKGVPGYTFNALKGDYRPKDIDYDAIIALSGNEKTTNERNNDDERRKAAREKLAEFNNNIFPAWRFQEWVNSATSNEYQQTWDRFYEEVLKCTPLLMKRYTKNEDAPMVTAHFRTFVRTHVLPAPTKDDENRCALEQGVAIVDLRTEANLKV